MRCAGRVRHARYCPKPKDGPDAAGRGHGGIRPAGERGQAGPVDGVGQPVDGMPRAANGTDEMRRTGGVVAATVNFPFVATKSCTPWWLAGSAPRSTLLTSSTGKERGSDARMGDEDVAETLPGPGRLEGRVVETLRGESPDDPRVGRDGAVGPGPRRRRRGSARSVPTAPARPSSRGSPAFVRVDRKGRAAPTPAQMSRHAAHASSARRLAGNAGNRSSISRTWLWTVTSRPDRGTAAAPEARRGRGRRPLSTPRCPTLPTAARPRVDDHLRQDDLPCPAGHDRRSATAGAPEPSVVILSPPLAAGSTTDERLEPLVVVHRGAA